MKAAGKFWLVHNILHFTNPFKQEHFVWYQKKPHDHVVHILLSNAPDNATCLSLVMSWGMSEVYIT